MKETSETIRYLQSKPAERRVKAVVSRGLWQLSPTGEDEEQQDVRLDVHRCVCGAPLAIQLVFGLDTPDYTGFLLEPGLQQAKTNRGHFFRPNLRERSEREQQEELGDGILSLVLPKYLARFYTKTSLPWLPTGQSLFVPLDQFTVACGCGRVVEVTRQG